MFCIKCGKENPESAAFCQKCGSSVGNEQETVVRPRVQPDPGHDDEVEVFSIGPTLIFVKMGYVAAALLAVVFVAVAAPILPSWIYAAVIGLCFLTVPAYKHVMRRLVRYTLTDSKIQIDMGLLVRNSRIVPLRSIQDVSVTASLLQRLMGFGDVVIDNASEDGGKIILKDIPSPKRHADLLLRELRKTGR